MDIEKLIERLKNAAGGPDGIKMCQQAATALSTLQAENEEMQKQLNEFSEFLCHMTGNLLSKTNYTAQAMIEAAEDYQQRMCDDCDRVKVVGNDELIDELQSVQADLARVTAERDAAVKDLNEFLSMDELCPIQCEWCKWNGTYCDGKTPEWRGIKED